MSRSGLQFLLLPRNLDDSENVDACLHCSSPAHKASGAKFDSGHFGVLHYVLNLAERTAEFPVAVGDSCGNALISHYGRPTQEITGAPRTHVFIGRNHTCSFARFPVERDYIAILHMRRPTPLMLGEIALDIILAAIQTSSIVGGAKRNPLSTRQNEVVGDGTALLVTPVKQPAQKRVIASSLKEHLAKKQSAEALQRRVEEALAFIEGPQFPLISAVGGHGLPLPMMFSRWSLKPGFDNLVRPSGVERNAFSAASDTVVASRILAAAGCLHNLWSQCPAGAAKPEGGLRWLVGPAAVWRGGVMLCGSMSVEFAKLVVPVLLHEGLLFDSFATRVSNIDANSRSCILDVTPWVKDAVRPSFSADEKSAIDVGFGTPDSKHPQVILIAAGHRHFCIAAFCTPSLAAYVGSTEKCIEEHFSNGVAALSKQFHPNAALDGFDSITGENLSALSPSVSGVFSSSALRLSILNAGNLISVLAATQDVHVVGLAIVSRLGCTRWIEFEKGSRYVGLRCEVLENPNELSLKSTGQTAEKLAELAEVAHWQTGQWFANSVEGAAASELAKSQNYFAAMCKSRPATQHSSLSHLSIFKKAERYREKKAKKTTKRLKDVTLSNVVALPSPGWRWWTALRRGGNGVLVALLIRVPETLPEHVVLGHCSRLPLCFGAVND